MSENNKETLSEKEVAQMKHIGNPAAELRSIRRRRIKNELTSMKAVLNECLLKMQSISVSLEGMEIRLALAVKEMKERIAP